MKHAPDLVNKTPSLFCSLSYSLLSLPFYMHALTVHSPVTRTKLFSYGSDAGFDMLDMFYAITFAVSYIGLKQLMELYGDATLAYILQKAISDQSNSFCKREPTSFKNISVFIVVIMTTFIVNFQDRIKNTKGPGANPIQKALLKMITYYFQAKCTCNHN